MIYRTAIACAAVGLLMASPVLADPLGDAKAGLDALNKGDNAGAIRLFNSALSAGTLAASDRELAYVKRAEAYLASGNKPMALVDAQQALGIDPKDEEAAQVRDKASGAVSGPSLVDTLNFMKKVLEENGTENWTVYAHSTTNNTDYTNAASDTKTNITILPQECAISFHQHVATNGATSDNDWKVLFSLGHYPTVQTWADFENSMITDGITFYFTQTSPTIIDVSNGASDGKGYSFSFRDQDTAERFAKALSHATDLCSAPKAPDPF